MNTEKINGYGVYFRFITPILVTIAIFVLGLLMSDMQELKRHFSNHLGEHKHIEILLEKRLSRIEAILEGVK